MTDFNLGEYLQNRLTEQYDRILSETATPETVWNAKVRISELTRLALNAGFKITESRQVIRVVSTT